MNEELFNNIPHFIKNRCHLKCLQGYFTMYNDTVLIRIWEVVPPIPYYMIPEYFCQKNQYVSIFTYDYIISKFEEIKKKKLDTIYQTESMKT